MSVRNRIGSLVFVIVVVIGIIAVLRRLDLVTTLKRMHGLASVPIETLRGLG